jgi:ABC-type transporter Mla subunit MlaD
MRLIEETETHVLVRLLLLLFLLLLGGRGLSSATSSGTAGSGSTTTAAATGWDGGKLGRALGDELRGVSRSCSATFARQSVPR